MKYCVILLAVMLKVNFVFAQYVPPVRGPENMAVYCVADYHVVADSMFYSLAPGESKELRVDLGSTCSSYLNDDVTLQIGVSFKHDPRWQKGKDQIVVQGFSFEVIDAATGENLVSLAKSLGAPACNWGSGFVFSDLTKLPMVLRPVILRLKNNGRDAKEAAWTLHYDNKAGPSRCGDYPRGR